jgi:hypothetical protein
VLKPGDVPAHAWSDDVLLWGGEKTHLVHYPLRRGELFLGTTADGTSRRGRLRHGRMSGASNTRVLMSAP